MNFLKNKKVWLGIGILHFILSFFYEGILFTDTAMDGVVMIHNTTGEILFCHILSKILGGVIIIFLWQLVPLVLNNWKEKKAYFIPFFIITGLYMTVAVVTYPRVWEWNLDNYVDYSMAIRYMPDYWQYYFTNIVYSASLQVFPHPLSLTFVECMGFSGALGYLYGNMKESFPESKWRYLTWSIILFPTAAVVAIFPYRNSFYMIVCLWTLTFITFEYIKKASLTLKKTIIYLLLAVILSGWRSEGIIFIIFIPIFMVLIYKKELTKKRCLIFLVSMLAIYYIFSLPQNMGMKKYFGKDYLIINLTNSTLCYMLNNENINLSYEGADQDLENINNIISLDYIKQIPDIAYQKYNEDQGRFLSQTLATPKDQAAFVSSAYHIIFHNPVLFIRERFYCFAKALGISWPDTVSTPTDEGIENPTSLNEFTKLYTFGKNEIQKTVFWTDVNSGFHGAVYQVYNLFTQYRDAILTPVMISCRLFVICFLLFELIVSLIKRRWFWFTICINLGFQIGIIFLMEPVAREFYFYPMFYCGIMVFMVFTASVQKTNKNIQVADQNEK